MKTVILSAALAATASAGTLSLDVGKDHAQPAKRFARRDDEVAAVKLSDAGFRYFVDLEIGTPAQKIPLTIDTGSSDTWTITVQSGICDDEKTFPCTTPFDLEKSKTLKRLNVSGPYDDYKLPFKVVYGGGQGANGTYITDTVSIGGVSLKNTTLGAANVSDIPNGIMGLGYNIVQGDARAKDPMVNHTIIDALASSGAINRRIFSLSLGHTSSTNGTLTFGGVDTERYYDSLASVKLVPSRGAPYVIEYAVKLEGLEVKGIDGLSGSSESSTAILDNGAPQCLLPADIVDPLFKKFETASFKDPRTGTKGDGIVNCAMGKKYADSRFGFKFDGKTIYITGEEAVRDVFSPGEQLGYKQLIGSKSDDWDGVCLFAFGSQLKGLPSLVGDPMLRHAYAVYDLDHKVIGLAQANIGSTKQNVVEIGKNDGIPDTKGAAAPKSISDPGKPGNDKDDDPKSGDSDNNGGGNGDGGNGKNGDDGKDGKDGKGDDTKSAALRLAAPGPALLLAVVGAAMISL